jgi:alpha-soluble NSF attachment protein
MVTKASDLRILTRNFGLLSESIKQYDKIGCKYLTVNLIRSSAKDLFYKAILCYLANDDGVGAKRAISTYAIEDPSFDGSREQKFLLALLETCQDGLSKPFNSLIADYNNITPMDKVKTTLIVRIKEIYIQEEAPLKPKTKEEVPMESVADKH